jgi:nicotinate-nucleotide--dimethylbenzimidazole phosphoribosyltransferase
MQRSQQPSLERVRIVVFAADHGVVAEGVSAYPQAVTAEMIRNFARGGAAISVLAREWGADLEVVNVGTVESLEALPGVVDRRIASGTANFAQGPAMTLEQLAEALLTGREAAERAAASKTQLFIGGDMGIGNTTSAAALGCALLGVTAWDLVGPGTGLDKAGVAHKAGVIKAALAQHATPDPLEALAALHLRPELSAWLFYAHRSAETGHRRLLEALEAKPLLDLDMRLGEGSGAAMALPLLRAAVALHGRMATFDEAGVSTCE